MTKKYHAAVFIGRMSPLHLGHEHVINTALEQANEVIVILGSSFAARSFRNPFTFEERRAMIKAVYPQDNVKVVPVSDYPYDDNQWVAAVQNLVYGAMTYTPDPIKIALIGHKKDETSYYLNLFKSWSSISVDNLNGFNATDIRNSLFLNNLRDFYVSKRMMSPNAFDYMNRMLLKGGTGKWSKVFEDIVDDYEKVQGYHQLWNATPFPVTFITGDAVLTQSGSVLLIKRGDFPFKDKWALPGGYLNQSETILSGVLRELREETKVKVPEKVLRGSIKSSAVFDHPHRDPRGRTVTHAYHIDLGFPNEDLPKVKGSDDAKEARWFQFAELKQEEMAFDHWHILNHFLKIG
jgi:bifunctional NMN adenylyltransferase/nudix hydrolase